MLLHRGLSVFLSRSNGQIPDPTAHPYEYGTRRQGALNLCMDRSTMLTAAQIGADRRSDRVCNLSPCRGSLGHRAVACRFTGGDRWIVERFEAATSRYRREPFAHCYWMTGSVQEAEDIVQDTYVRAWRALSPSRLARSRRTVPGRRVRAD